MEKDTFLKIKSEYEEKITARTEFEKELEKLKSKVRIMQMHPAVCQFFEILEEYNKKIDIYNSFFDTNNVLLMETADEYSKLNLIKDTNKILFYRGSFSSNHVQSFRIDSTAEYDLYIDIESLEKTKNPIQNREYFESNNNVIVTTNYPTQKELEKIRNEFFKTAVEEGQEKASIKVLNRK